MGYSPKHAKPVSLRGTALKSHHKPVGPAGTPVGHGRHRAGTAVPVPRVPDHDPVPADEPPTPDETLAADDAAAPAGDAAAPAAGDAVPATAPGASGAPGAAVNAPCVAGARGTEHAAVLTRLVPPQRAPLPGS